MQYPAENLIQNSVEDIAFAKIILLAADWFQTVFLNLESAVFAAEINILPRFLHFGIVAVLIEIAEFLRIIDVCNVKNRNFAFSRKKSASSCHC